ncbi:TIR domain-containing protein [Leptolyngbya sp. CCNP1308]|uniref:TIR domain-containing protein n=1 Tax=Leptolyngbya sp. CCNP1308 TaxID=3110255 RepID=UPI002B20B427|nr:TIR domain-containing protein [Leptolyngbya sp. CCNP1308]MEA5449369.1 TIR domain-containing protein [Leptolyngbya sp. CCNP1308]
MSGDPSDSYEYDVFISYSTADKAWVRGELLTRLRQAGLKVCIDYEDFRLGAPAIKEIERSAMTSRKTLLVLTPNYLQSGWTEFERYLLQTPDPNNRELRLLPMLKEACELPPSIGYLSYVNFTDPEELDIAWRQVFRAFGIAEVEAAPSQAETPKRWLLAHPYGMPPHFTGRVAERQRLSDWLHHSPQPLLVLQALGGFGKSALTWHWLLHDVKEQDWPLVVWWSFYEEKAGFDNFVSATLAYLSGQEPQDLPPAERVARLLEYVRQHRILLVLDGFERELRAYGNLGAAYQGDGEQETDDAGRDCVNPGAEQFLRNLASLPRLKGKVLMSTRLRPRPVEVNGGALLLGCREEGLTQMQAADAVAFFRVQGIRGNRGEIEQACGAYGFHPLSLRLLAGLVVKDLRNPGDIQAAGRKDLTGSLVQRQNHVLAQAYASLTADGRQLLSRMACFRSPVVFDVLEELAAAGSDVEGDLQDLIERGLVQREGARFDLHPIVRRYAYDRMDTEERSSTHGQLRDYFAAVPAVERVTTVDDLAPVIELYHHMVRAGQYDEAQKLFENRLANLLYYQLGAYQQCIELLRALFPQGETHIPQLQDEGAQAWTLNTLGNSYSLSGQPTQAVPLFEQQTAIREKQGNKQNWAIGLGNLALDQIRIGALQSAEANLHSLLKLALCQETEDEFQQAVGHQELGRLLAYRGAWGVAETSLTDGLNISEKISKIQAQGIGWAHRALSSLLQARSAQTSDPQSTELAAAALAAAQRAISLADEWQKKVGRPNARDYVRAHWLLGAAHRLTPNLSASDHHLSEALRRCRAINLVDQEADILIDLARLRRDQGDLSEARRLAEEARAIAARSGYVLQGADCHLVLAELAQAAGNLPEARALAQAALQLATCDGGEFVYRVAYDEAVALLSQLGG